MLTNDTFWPMSRQPAYLVKRAELYCLEHGVKRSELTRRALNEHLDNNLIKQVANK